MTTITPRELVIDTTSIPKYWALNAPYPTHFLNSISLAFPPMEKFAVISMRAALRELNDDNEVLIDQIKAFCQQENNHSAVHNTFNKIALDGMDKPQALTDLEVWCKSLSNRSTKERVAIVIAFEYFTASCSRLLMKTLRTAIDGGRINEEIFKLWYWHCGEEIEHHSVGWSLMEPLGLTKADLNKAVKEYFKVFYPYILKCTNELLSQDSVKKQPKTWLGASVFLSRHFRRMTPYYLGFFKPSFSEHQYSDIDAELMEDFYSFLTEYDLN